MLCYIKIQKQFLQVLVEVYASRDLDAEAHILLSLVLYKMVDPQLEVRDDALHMLRVLSMRVWKEGLVPPRPDTETSSNPSGIFLSRQFFKYIEVNVGADK